MDGRLPFQVITCLVERMWGQIEVPLITVLDNDLIISHFRRADALDSRQWSVAPRR